MPLTHRGRKPVAEVQRRMAPAMVGRWPCWLGAIVVLALALRLCGLAWGLPWAFHPDEVLYVERAQEMVQSGDPNPAYFQNPSLLTYLVAAELLALSALGVSHGPLAPFEPGAAYLLARLDGALLGSAAVPLLYAIGAALFNRRVGLIGALLLAVAFLHVRDSHYGVNDVPATTLLLLSLYFIVRLLQQPAPRWYLLAGLAGGLAISTKYNMGFFFVPLLVAHWLGGRSARQATGPANGCWASHPWTRLAIALVASIVGYLLGTPYTLLDFQRFAQDFLAQYQLGSHRKLGQSLTPVPVQYLTSLLQGFGAVPLALAVLGVLLGWGRQRPALLLLLAFPASYLAFLLPKALFHPRFALPLLPSLSLLAAYGAVELLARLPAGPRTTAQTPEAEQTATAVGPLEAHQSHRLGRQRIALAAVLVAAVAQSLTNDLLHDWLLLRTDTRILANVWVQANIPPGSRVRMQESSLGDLSTASRTYTPNTADLQLERFEDGMPDTRGVQYVIVSSFVYGRDQLDPSEFAKWSAGPGYRRLQRMLEQRARLIAQFSPGRGGYEVPFRFEDIFTPFWSLEQYERPGPTVRIYALPP